MTSNPPSTDTIDYVVYMPFSKRATPNPISVQAGAEVEDLIAEIYKVDEFKSHVKSETVHLYACGELPVEPSKGRYNRVAEWLRGLLEGSEMDPSSRLTRYQQIPALEENEVIDVIAVTDSILNSILAMTKDQEPERTRVGSGSGSESLRRLVTFEYSGNIPNIRWDEAVTQNEFNRDTDIPQFVKDIVDQARRPPNDESRLLLPVISASLDRLPRREGEVNGFAKLFDNLFCDAETKTAHPYVAWNLELAHFAFAAANSVTPQERGPLNEGRVRRLVLDWFDTFWLREVDSSKCLYNQSIPFPVVVRLLERDEKRKWTPTPYATFLEHKIPRFLVEIDSHCNGQDEHRLNVYAACVLRLLACLKEEHGLREEYDKKVFLMAAYFSDSWKVNRYFFFMDDKDKVCRNLQTFDMKDAFESTHFLREFYNYAFYVKTGAEKCEQAPDMDEISKAIIGSIKKSLNTKDLLNPKGGGEPMDNNKQRNCRNSSNSEQYDDVDIHAAMVDGLQGTDYELEEYPEEFGPLLDYPDYIAEARDSNKHRLIVKLVRKSSNERSLLEELSKQKSPLNHVVPLFNTVMSELGPLLILERGNSLLIVDVDKDKAERLSRELIEGVAFLHGQNIAHLDIKPDNIICTFKTERLLIIDFDIAMKCNSVDETVERSCGTTGWSAPEIVLDDDKPLRAFSPIRADLWSTGKVLQFIADESGYRGFVQLTNMLIDGDPQQRPLLHEVVDEESVSWTTREFLQAFGCYHSNKED